MHRIILVVVSSCLVVACDSAPREAGSPRLTVSAPRTVAPARVAAGDLARLRWLEGDWRGSGGSYEAFYERYAFLGDTAIRQYNYADSTFSAPSDSSTIRVRDDQLVSEGSSSRYMAVALSDDSVAFVPLAGANGFTWRRVSDDEWIAILVPVDTTRARVEYRMRRLER